MFDGLADECDLALPARKRLFEVDLQQPGASLLVLHGQLELREAQVLVQAQRQLVPRTQHVHLLLQRHLLHAQVVELTVCCRQLLPQSLQIPVVAVHCRIQRVKLSMVVLEHVADVVLQCVSVPLNDVQLMLQLCVLQAGRLVLSPPLLHILLYLK